MTRVEHFCDRCHERIPADRSTMEVQCGPLRRSYFQIDLCPGCVDRLVEWLGPPGSRIPRGTPHEATTPSPARRPTAPLHAV